MSKIDKTYVKKLLIALLIIFLTPEAAFAEMDPATQASRHMASILFGTLGTSLSAIFVGATFIMAKAGKISWDKFVFNAFCVAGFLGAPSIVNIIRSWV